MGNAKVGTPITVYTVGGFGASTTRGKLGAIYEPGNGRKGVIYTPKGKRKEDRTSAPTLLVLIGHDHPDAPGGLVQDGNFNGSRYASFDRRYHTDFNKWARENLTDSLPADLILVNQREHDGETDPTIDARM